MQPQLLAAIAAQTPLCRELLRSYRLASADAQDAMLYLMCAPDFVEAEQRAPQAALAEQKAQSLFIELRTALIRSRPGGFDPLRFNIEVSEA